MQKLGFLVSKLAGCQLGYMILRNVIRYYANGGDADILVFHQNVSRTHRVPPFATLNLVEIFDFDGVAVATSMSTAEALLRAPGPTKRIFYVWDLEWLRGTHLSYEEQAAIYQDPHLTLVARSESHRKVIENCWNVEVPHVIEDCNLDEFLNILIEKVEEVV